PNSARYDSVFQHIRERELVASGPLEALLPVLVTRLTDPGDRAYLGGVALAGEVVQVPLVDAPVDPTLHVLEVHVRGFEEPLKLYAEPMGPRGDIGYPLRLRPLSEAQAGLLRLEVVAHLSAASGSADDAETDPYGEEGPPSETTLVQP